MNIFLDALSRTPTISIGTQALIIGSMQIINRYQEGVEFIMLTANERFDDAVFGKLGYKVTMVRRPRSQLGTIRALRSITGNVNAVVSAWGDGYITTPPHRMLQKCLFLKPKYGPCVLFPSSVGPFATGRLKRTLAKKALGVFNRIMARDTVTLQYLRDLGFDDAILVPDTAFVLEPAPRQRVEEILAEEGVPTGSSFIGVNVSQLLNVRYTKRTGASYAKLIADVASRLHEISQLSVLLIPHQIYPESLGSVDQEARCSSDGDDRYAVSEVMKRLGQGGFVIPIMGEYSCREYKGLIARCEVFVGGRMHSVIAAVSSGVPAAIMQYSHKAPGTMAMIGLGDFVWDIGAPEEDLSGMLDALWHSRLSLRSQLEQTMPAIKRDAWQAGELLLDALQNYT